MSKVGVNVVRSNVYKYYNTTIFAFYTSFFKTEFDGVKITSSIVFNRPETLQTNAEEGETSSGPLVSSSSDHDSEHSSLAHSAGAKRAVPARRV